MYLLFILVYHLKPDVLLVTPGTYWNHFQRNSIRDGGVTALYAVYTVGTVTTSYTVDTVDMV